MCSLQESKIVEQEGGKVLGETKEASEVQQENSITSEPPDLTSAQEVQESPPTEQLIPETTSNEPSESVTLTTTTTTTTTPQPQLVLQPGEPHPVNPSSQSRVYTLPDAYRGNGGDICPRYGSLSRFSLHGYLPTKNFQPGVHYTLPFLRDSYAPAGLSSQTDEDSKNPLDMKAEHPAASYPTLGGIHQFRPITTMELLREPSRTR